MFYSFRFTSAQLKKSDIDRNIAQSLALHKELLLSNFKITSLVYLISSAVFPVSELLVSKLLVRPADVSF